MEGSLLWGLYSKDKWQYSKAESALCSYVDSITANKLFGLDCNIAIEAYKHKRNISQPPMPKICSFQDLWNLQFKHGEPSLKDDKLLICGKCKSNFNHKKWSKMWTRQTGLVIWM
jgi:hypothetical protein